MTTTVAPSVDVDGKAVDNVSSGCARVRAGAENADGRFARAAADCHRIEGSDSVSEISLPEAALGVDGELVATGAGVQREASVNS